MSSLSILIAGNNPNVLFYTSRFQLAKNINLYYINDFKSDTYQIETNLYRKVIFQTKNHYSSVEEMLQSSNQAPSTFDIILMNATSVHALKTLAKQLNPLINSNTKVIIESTGSLVLEPFVAESIDLNIPVFSVLSSYDIRCINNPTEFQQFSKSSEKGCGFYLGSLFNKKLLSKGSAYDHQTDKILHSLQRLFQKLFPLDRVDICQSSPFEYLTKQWTYSITGICLDPLLVIFGEMKPSSLESIDIAKPLILGLISEVKSIIDRMGVILPNEFSTAKSIMKFWMEKYMSANNNEISSPLAYNFEKKLLPLEFDIQLIQPIFLANELSVKVPYIEFLYASLQQFNKFNDGNSQIFTRKVSTENIDQMHTLAVLDIGKLTKQQKLLEDKYNKRESNFTHLQQINQDLETEKMSLQKTIHNLKVQLCRTSQDNNIDLNQNLPPANSKTFGNFIDFEDLAVHAVDYGEHRGNNIPRSKETYQLNNHSVSSSKERELVLYRKELDLKEKELELRMKMLYHQQIRPHIKIKDHISNRNSFLSSVNDQQILSNNQSHMHRSASYSYDDNYNRSHSSQQQSNNYPIRTANRKYKVNDSSDIRRVSTAEFDSFRNTLPLLPSMELISGYSNRNSVISINFARSTRNSYFNDNDNKVNGQFNNHNNSQYLRAKGPNSYNDFQRYNIEPNQQLIYNNNIQLGKAKTNYTVPDGNIIHRTRPQYSQNTFENLPSTKIFSNLNPIAAQLDTRAESNINSIITSKSNSTSLSENSGKMNTTGSSSTITDISSDNLDKKKKRFSLFGRKKK